MKDIVEAALNRAEDEYADSETSETTEVSPDEFGPLRFAVVGCGDDGISWLTDEFTYRPRIGMLDERVDFDATTIAVGDPSAVGDASEADEVIPVEPSEGRATPTATDSDFEGSSVANRQYDVAVVVGNGSRVRDAASMERVCRQLDEETVAIVMPVVFTDALSPTESEAFRRVVANANTTIPLERARIRDLIGNDDDASDGPVSDGDVERMLTGLSRDLFELLDVPIAAPVDRAQVWELLENGGLTRAYWVWGTRDDSPETIVDHAVSNHLCRGESGRPTGGLGLFRFGAPFTRGEFDAVDAYLDEHLGPPDGDGQEWLLGGMVTRGLSEQCRLVLFETGLGTDALSFCTSS